MLVSGVIGDRFDADEALDVTGESVEPRRSSSYKRARICQTRAQSPATGCRFRSHLTNARAFADPEAPQST